MGTILLNMEEHNFWKCTPRKLFALYAIYKEVNGHDNETVNNEPTGYIDDVIF